MVLIRRVRELFWDGVGFCPAAVAFVGLGPGGRALLVDADSLADAQPSNTLMSGIIRSWRGRPIAFYVDKDSIYKVNRQATIDEELKDMHPITHYTRAMSELDIQVICADTPQAKGRVERGFDTHQDRLVKELRLAGISTKEAANRFLWDVYLPAHNEHFSIAPVSDVDAHRPLRTLANHLDEILSIQTERQLANDFTLRFQNKFFQVLLHKPLRIRPKNKVLFEFRLDGSIHLRFKGVYLPFKAISKPVDRPHLPADVLAFLKPDRIPNRPPCNHPWRANKDPVLHQTSAALH